MRDRPVHLPPPRLRHGSNGDEERYENRGWIGTYTKGLKHSDDGEVEAESFLSFRKGTQERSTEEVLNIRLGCGRLLANPLAGLARDRIGPNPELLPMRSAPTLDSAEAAVE